MAKLLRQLSREPLHPPTTHFPIALYPMAVLFDILALTRQDGTSYTHAAFVVMVAATVMAGFAMVTGFVHLIRDVHPNSPAWRVALLHGAVQFTAVSILFTSFILRIGHVNDPQPSTVAFVLGIAGTVLLLSGGWVGGRLVYSHGVGIKSTHAESNQTVHNDDGAGRRYLTHSTSED